ncbi:MAG: hypothetical protein H5T64_09220 [Chloroflexi bacterium]|nr:hypothetical protein [Chloroflexota bacterium]
MKKRTLGCVGLLFACVALMFFYIVIYGRPKTRAQPVNMYDLMVDVSAFPQGWDVEFGPSHPPPRKHLRGESEGLYVQFARGFDHGAMHIVCRYTNDLTATVSFYVDNEFPNLREAMITPWAVPEGWSYESPVADRFKFACAELEILGRFRSCSAVAQYGEYISVFRSKVSPEYMTLQDLERILKAIDERMAQHLKGNSR